MKTPTFDLNMRITLPYLIPLILLLLLIVALQPARAQDGPPCMASPVTLYGSDRAEYSGEFNAAQSKLQADAQDYSKESGAKAAEYQKDAQAYNGESNATAGKYLSDAKSYMADANATDAEYKTAAATHQSDMDSKRKGYLNKGCPMADTGKLAQ